MDRKAIERHPFVYAWAKMMGSQPYYIEDQLDKADAMKAPYFATYERDGEWNTIKECSNVSAVNDCERILADAKITIKEA